MLIKPQFEVGKDHVGKGGVVKDPAQHARARDMVRRACTDLGGPSTRALPARSPVARQPRILHLGAVAAG